MPIFIIVLFLLTSSVHAQKVLIYDEQKGIIFVDKDSDPPKKKEPKKTVIKAVKKKISRPDTSKKLTRAKGPNEIHANRKKDPPGLYFKSGLEYYKNKDFNNALKNFQHAVDQKIKPEYLLWIGKTYRRLNKKVPLFSTMEQILKDYPDSDVADDALFEMAFYYQKNSYYELSTEKYKQLIEQYPFGLSYSNGEEFLDIARDQMRMMRGEMISSLKILGIKGETLSDTYKKFQKLNNIKITGTGTPETVIAIKAQFSKKIKKDDETAASVKRQQKSIKLALIICVILLINTLVIIIVRVKVSQNRKQLVLIKEMITDM